MSNETVYSPLSCILNCFRRSSPNTVNTHLRGYWSWVSITKSCVTQGFPEDFETPLLCSLTKIIFPVMSILFLILLECKATKNFAFHTRTQTSISANLSHPAQTKKRLPAYLLHREAQLLNNPMNNYFTSMFVTFATFASSGILGNSTSSTPLFTFAAILLRSTSSGKIIACWNFE